MLKILRIYSGIILFASCFALGFTTVANAEPSTSDCPRYFGSAVGPCAVYSINLTPNKIGVCTCSQCGTAYGYKYHPDSYTSGYITLDDGWQITQVNKCVQGEKIEEDCQKGYYKDGSDCKRCPSIGGVYGTTASSGSTSITDCCVPASTSFPNDGKGSGSFSGECCYSN